MCPGAITRTILSATAALSLLVAAGTAAHAQDVARPGYLQQSDSPSIAIDADRDPATLSELVRLAVENDPEVAVAVSRVMQREEGIAAARAGYFPQVSVGTRSEYNSSLDRNVDVASVTASQLLYDFGRIGADVSAARHGTEQERLNHLMAVDALAADTARTVTDLQQQQRFLEEAQAQTSELERIVDLVEYRGRLGAAARSDGEFARARQDSARLVQAQIERASAEAQRNLQRLLRQDRLPPMEDDGAPELRRACEAATGGELDGLPSVRLAEAERAEARSALDRARADRWPRISLDVRGDRFFDSRVANQTQTSVFLNVTADLYTGGAIGARSRGAEFGVRAAESGVETARMDARQVLRQAVASEQELRAEQQILHDRVSHLEQVRELYEMQYRTAGTRSLLDLLNAEQEYFQSRFDLVELEYAMRRLALDCLEASAQLRAVFDLHDLASLNGNGWQ